MSTTAHPLPAPATVPPVEATAKDGDAAANEQALVTVPSEPEEEEDNQTEFSGPVSRLPVEVDVTVPVRDFRVRNLLALAKGQLIESQWGNGEDVPQLAVRVTRLA
jgi:flagellar motor switch/type III secretory pathway protein FliN